MAVEKIGYFQTPITQVLTVQIVVYTVKKGGAKEGLIYAVACQTHLLTE
jgi:hypothetical protein